MAQDGIRDGGQGGQQRRRPVMVVLALLAVPALAQELPGPDPSLRLPPAATWRMASSLPTLPALRREPAAAPVADLARTRDLAPFARSDELPGSRIDWRAGIGLQLDPGTRIGVRRANGGTQIVWRSQF